MSQICLVVTQRELEHSTRYPRQKQIAIRSPSADIRQSLVGLSLKNRVHIMLGGFITLDVADPGAIWLAHNAKHKEAFEALFSFLATKPDHEIRLPCEIEALLGNRSEFTPQQVHEASKFLQEHMRRNGLGELTADECADLLAANDILSNDVGPRPGFNFRQMLRDGRDGKIPAVTGAYQERPGTRWHIQLIALSRRG